LIKKASGKKILIIKTSSLGDVIHTLPALSDAQKALGDVQFDWIVEENFAEIPRWHPAVNQVIPIAIRRWRKKFLKMLLHNKDADIERKEWQNFKQIIQQTHYDAVIDAQGLFKSAWITRYTNGTTYGLDKKSAREPLAAYFYDHPQAVDKKMHAVERLRTLFAQSLNYSLKDLPLDYGISQRNPSKPQENNSTTDRKTILFLHGTTWDTKHWPETYWIELSNLLTEKDFQIIIPWGSDIEYQRAVNIKNSSHKPESVNILKKMNLNELSDKISRVNLVVAVDTGLAHLSAALDKPTIAIYGPTSPGLTGTYGNNQHHLISNIQCSPCFKKHCNKEKNNISPECYTEITPEKVIKYIDKEVYGKCTTHHVPYTSYY